MVQFDTCTLTGNITVSVNTINVNSSPSTNVYDVLIYLIIFASICVLAYIYVNKFNSARLADRAHAVSPQLNTVTEKVENSAREETIPHTTVGSDKQDNVDVTDLTAECQAGAEIEFPNGDNDSSDGAMAVPNRPVPPQFVDLVRQVFTSNSTCQEIELKSENRLNIRTSPTSQDPQDVALCGSYRASAAVDGQRSIKENDELKTYFNFIADTMAIHWPQLATNLGLKLHQIQLIKQQNNNDCWMCCHHILETWRSNNGREATKEGLIQAVKETGNLDVAEKLEDM